LRKNLHITILSLFGTEITFKVFQPMLSTNNKRWLNKKPRYCKDDRTMHPIYECPENCM